MLSAWLGSMTKNVRIILCLDIHQVTISGARVEYAGSSHGIGRSFFLLHVLLSQILI